MRVLMVHAYYRQRGGEDESFAIEVKLLRDRGHTVAVHTVANEDFADRSPVSQALGTVWNAGTSQEIKGLVEHHRPEVVHFQNTFPSISPAAFWSARSKAAVVNTVQNFRPVCVNALLYREGAVCELCVGKAVPWHGVRYACYRNSRPASLVVGSMIAVHKVVGTWSRAVDRYIITNEEARRTLSATIPAEKMVRRPNTIWPEPTGSDGGGGYAIFVGRLTPEKGIFTLLRSWDGRTDDLPLLIVGDGPLRDTVSNAADGKRIRYLGRLDASDVLDLIGLAECLVFPSEWYEGFPRVILEALASGTPVVASSIGAAGEIVVDGVSGALFEPGDPDDCSRAVDRAFSGGKSLRRSVRKTYEQNYSAETGYRTLLDVYQQAIEARWGESDRSTPT